ncbi:hypothetical protein AAFF_G00039630 [Aldrovandia affinis]|uniref:Uncharacterized protein n=1 Tax=Aldrovandia affinis TaxID=143900 RepID=A0AAD7S2Z4_9TELE|nr:hypothetical protein AAFF_G00039630 [Aldrovandia affinis]
MNRNNRDRRVNCGGDKARRCTEENVCLLGAFSLHGRASEISPEALHALEEYVGQLEEPRTAERRGGELARPQEALKSRRNARRRQKQEKPELKHFKCLSWRPCLMAAHSRNHSATRKSLRRYARLTCKAIRPWLHKSAHEAKRSRR